MSASVATTSAAAAGTSPAHTQPVNYYRLWRNDAGYDPEMFVSLVYQRKIDPVDVILWLEQQHCSNATAYHKVMSGLKQLASN